jgi:hypothetical protein
VAGTGAKLITDLDPKIVRLSVDPRHWARIGF